MIIKDRTIGEGKPCICVPIVSPTIAGIKTECKKIASSPAEIIEWRIDYFLVSDCIKDKVVRSEMLDSGDRQDHAPLVLELDI